MTERDITHGGPPDFIQAEGPDVETSNNLEAQLGTPEGGNSGVQSLGDRTVGGTLGTTTEREAVEDDVVSESDATDISSEE
jgi:hypothetical protein